MNALLPIIAPAADEASAFLSLALTERRNAHLYRQWAREDEQRGDLTAYRRNSKEADRLQASARWHLARARLAQQEYAA